MAIFERGELIYWIANEDSFFEVREAKVLNYLPNGEYIIDCDGEIISSVLSFCMFKHDNYGRKSAYKWAWHFINSEIQKHKLAISELCSEITEIVGDSEDDQYKKLKLVALKDRLEGKLVVLGEMLSQNEAQQQKL